MNAIILSIGDELVLGQTVDTNSAWLSGQLAAVGCGVLRHLTVPDDQPAIERAIAESIKLCDVLIISGGIGPTEDDLTRQALAAVMGQPLESNEVWLKELQNFFAQRMRVMPEINKIQAMIPRGAQMIFNHAGTAAGIRAVVGRSEVGGQRLGIEQGLEARREGLDDRGERPTSGAPVTRASRPCEVHPHSKAVDSSTSNTQGTGETPVSRGSRSSDHQRQTSGSVPTSEDDANLPSSGLALAPDLHPQTTHLSQCEIFVLPGVPKEMKRMFTEDVLPYVQSRAGGAVILSRTLHTFGLGESAVAQKLGDLMRRDRNPSVGTTVSGGVVSLRVNARFPTLSEATVELEKTSQACRDAMGALIYGQDEQTLPDVVSKLLFEAPGTTVSTAESCTGGLLAKMLTDIPGSSAYFGRGWVTYANQAKAELLGVPAEVLAENGAVSEPVVRAMAVGARERANATFALSISGIAGPDGGTPEKPVGTVWLALARPGVCEARVFVFAGDREMIRDRSAKMALTMLRFHLLGMPLPF